MRRVCRAPEAKVCECGQSRCNACNFVVCNKEAPRACTLCPRGGVQGGRQHVAQPALSRERISKLTVHHGNRSQPDRTASPDTQHCNTSRLPRLHAACATLASSASRNETGLHHGNPYSHMAAGLAVTRKTSVQGIHGTAMYRIMKYNATKSQQTRILTCREHECQQFASSPQRAATRLLP